ncbi:MAG TPA: DUF5317 family protein [Acidimicrobiales bacterium]|nr:DUF5317 family protein [Acidimicrobiales bacterium]
MGFTAAAVVAGVVLGFLFGGRPSNISRRPLQLVSLLAVSVLLQGAAEALDVSDTLGLAMVLTSYVGLSAFAVANIRLVGMPVVLVGLVCNLVVITVNGGMPVEREAIVAAGVAADHEIADLDFGAKRHLEDGDALMFLGDIIPVELTEEVLSFGDLILAFGIADVIFRLLRPAVGRRREDDDDEDDEHVDLRSEMYSDGLFRLDLGDSSERESPYVHA